MISNVLFVFPKGTKEPEAVKYTLSSIGLTNTSGNIWVYRDPLTNLMIAINTTNFPGFDHMIAYTNRIAFNRHFSREERLLYYRLMGTLIKAKIAWHKSQIG